MQYVINLVKHFHRDSLYRNSIYLMLSTAVMAFFGFFFWMIAAKIYTTEDVGYAGSLISLTTLLAMIATLGLPTALIRYIPTSNNKKIIINSILASTILSATIVGIIFVIISYFVLKNFFPLINNSFIWPFYILTIIIATIQHVSDSTFIAYRDTKWILLQSAIFSILKLAIIRSLIYWGSLGIYFGNFIGMGIAIIVSLIVHTILDHLDIFTKIDLESLKEIGKYSAGSYISNIIGLLPTQILPTLVITTLGSEPAAHFFLALMIVNILIIIPLASNQSLFAVASHNQNKMRMLAIKSLKFQFILVFTGILIIWLIGGFIVSFFGKEYATETTKILKIISISVLPVIINYTFSIRLRVYARLKTLNILTFLGSLLILSLSLLGSNYGISGIAIGYVVGHIMLAIIFLIDYKFSIFSQNKKLLRSSLL